ncbi:MAG: inositol monophosphatase family protein [Candidatus Dormiibacterota bacterium]
MRETVLPLAGTEAGRAELTVGAGGDRTMELDRAAEAVAFGRLEGVAGDGERFSVISEEVGRRSFGADFPLVLVDPVDGSLNAKQGIPFFGLMLTVLDGPTVADTLAGYVLNLVNGEEWRAVRKQGAWRDGRPLMVQPPDDPGRVGLVALESNPRSLAAAQGLVASSSKVRILGSMALSIAHTAAGAFDAFCAPIPMRLFDMSASLLILSEAGGTATDLKGGPLGGLTCNLETRTTLLCSPTAELHAAALKAVASSR